MNTKKVIAIKNITRFRNAEIEKAKNDTSVRNLGNKIALWKGDITKLKVDAIVNAANESLRGGGGVDGAIHRAAGKKLLIECISLNGCDTGQAKITKGYNLPAKHVIHTVGPIGEETSLLTNCYKNSLNLLVDNKLKSIAFPCISTGIYGYPNENASHVALSTVKKFLEEHHADIDLIIFCLFMEKDINIYEKLAGKYFSLDIDDEAITSSKASCQAKSIPEKESSIDILTNEDLDFKETETENQSEEMEDSEKDKNDLNEVKQSVDISEPENNEIKIKSKDEKE